LTDGETFILASAFYLHDLGMATAATPEGAHALRQSTNYRTTEARLVASGLSPGAGHHALVERGRTSAPRYQG
jgi:hypothetical protein